MTERMPDPGARVLCVVKSFAFPGRKYCKIMRCDMYGFNENGIYTDDVTHWMPLPDEGGVTREPFSGSPENGQNSSKYYYGGK